MDKHTRFFLLLLQIKFPGVSCETFKTFIQLLIILSIHMTELRVNSTIIKQETFITLTKYVFTGCLPKWFRPTLLTYIDIHWWALHKNSTKMLFELPLNATPNVLQGVCVSVMSLFFVLLLKLYVNYGETNKIIVLVHVKLLNR